jgi:hypothetical protein
MSRMRSTISDSDALWRLMAPGRRRTSRARQSAHGDISSKHSDESLPSLMESARDCRHDSEIDSITPIVRFSSDGVNGKDANAKILELRMLMHREASFPYIFPLRT